MDDYRTENEIDIDSRRPGWVALAAILLSIGAALSAGQCLMAGLNFLSILLVGFNVFLLVVAFGLMTLKKWAYWSFLCVSVLGIMFYAADVLMFQLGLDPSIKLGVIHFVKFAISSAWVIYFCTKPVREAFQLGY